VKGSLAGTAESAPTQTTSITGHGEGGADRPAWKCGREIRVTRGRREEALYPLLKRTMDLAVSVVAILFFLPLFLVIALMIRFDSPGPVFFRQTRVGKDGKPFSFLKFRSMIKDAEHHKEALRELNEAEEPLFKIEKDPRVTRVGRILRKTSLDELPQMLNVLRGDMSLVGPRPHLPEEVSEYEEAQWKRLSVTPGITCLWQATNRRSTHFSEWIESDLEYVRRRSLRLDMEIMLRTVKIVVSLKEAS